jgi:ABC-2 type transport system permease protein
VVFVFILAFGVGPHWTWLLLPVLVAMLFAFTTAVSMIVASLFPRYRDVGIIWTVAATALFYATPVLYPLGSVSEHLRNVISLNPLAPIFELAHKWIIDPSAASPVVLTGGYARLLIPVGIYVGTCILAVWVFRREAPRIAEAL